MAAEGDAGADDMTEGVFAAGENEGGEEGD